MARRYSSDPRVDRSLHHSVRDAVAVSVQSGAGESYFGAFAVYLKATTGQIALLAALPSLVGSIAQLFSAWVAQRFGNRHTILMAGVRIQALMWLPIILLPLLFPEDAVPLFLGCAVIYYAAGSMVAPQWSSLMGDLVPARKRGRYFAYRSRLASITSFLALVGAGLALHLFDEAGIAFAGFITIFAAASMGRVVSIRHLARMHEPETRAANLVPTVETGLLARARHSPLVRFSLFYGVMQFSVAIASPFFTVYMLRDLHFTYLQFTANTAATVLLQFASLRAWGRISDRYGNRAVLRLAGAAIPWLPALWLISTNHFYLLATQAFFGIFWAGFSLAASNYFYDLVPSHKRITYLAYHNVLANIGLFLGAMTGGWIALNVPAQFDAGVITVTLPSTILAVFVVSFLARLVTAAAFLPALLDVSERRLRTNPGFRDAGFALFARVRTWAWQRARLSSW